MVEYQRQKQISLGFADDDPSSISRLFLRLSHNITRKSKITNSILWKKIERGGYTNPMLRMAKVDVVLDPFGQKLGVVSVRNEGRSLRDTFCNALFPKRVDADYGKIRQYHR